MYQVIIVIHVLLGLGIIGFVLIQQGKGADAGAAFGSGSSGSVFGSQGAGSFLSRTTAILAALFFSTSLGLAILSGHQDDVTGLMETIESEQIDADLPLVNGLDTSGQAESLPIINEESVLPGITPNQLEQTIVETVDGNVQEVIETVVEPVISDVVEKTTTDVDNKDP